MCGFCNVWLCVCAGFVMCGCVYVGVCDVCVCVRGFCDMWVCVCVGVCICVGFVMCVCIYVCVL